MIKFLPQECRIDLIKKANGGILPLCPKCKAPYIVENNKIVCKNCASKNKAKNEF